MTVEPDLATYPRMMPNFAALLHPKKTVFNGVSYGELRIELRTGRESLPSSPKNYAQNAKKQRKWLNM